MKKYALLALSLSLSLATSRAQEAEKKPETPATEPKDKKDKDTKGSDDEKSVTTQHKVKVAGVDLEYSATAAMFSLKKPEGGVRARVFHVAYRRSGLSPEEQLRRPTTFCFNGGPGSSAVWLHLGAFGPQRVDLGDPAGLLTAKPPFKLTPNEHSLLDATDLVFIDPVSTGYSRPEKPEDAKQFHGFSEDIESVGDFIRSYVSKNKLWDSPKFLMGESYGAIRGAGLTQHLQSRYGMYLNGLIIVSGVLDFQSIDSDGTNDLGRVCFFPSMAATAHFHKKLSPERQADFPKLIKDAETFAQSTYAAALLRGHSISAEEKENIAKQMSELIGLPVDLLLRENLRIETFTFFRKLLEKEERSIGRFDSRVVGAMGQGDPSYDVVFGAYAGCFNSYISEQLGFEDDRPYEILSRAVQPWNYSRFTNGYVSVTDDLSSALTTNPSLGVYIACGYRDMATPYRAIQHSIDHLKVDASLLKNIQYGYYDAGHMMYTNLPDLAKLAIEVRGFIAAKK